MDANFKSKRKITEKTLLFKASAEKVFPELCPTREYNWIENWACDLLWSDSGYAEDLCVFQTNGPLFGPETWICSTYEPNSRIVYVRFGVGWIIRLSFRLIESEADQSKWKLQIVFTSINEKGNRFLASLPENDETQAWDSLTKMLNYYLETGKCLKVS